MANVMNVELNVNMNINMPMGNNFMGSSNNVILNNAINIGNEVDDDFEVDFWENIADIIQSRQRND